MRATANRASPGISPHRVRDVIASPSAARWRGRGSVSVTIDGAPTGRPRHLLIASIDGLTTHTKQHNTYSGCAGVAAARLGLPGSCRLPIHSAPPIMASAPLPLRRHLAAARARQPPLEFYLCSLSLSPSSHCSVSPSSSLPYVVCRSRPCLMLKYRCVSPSESSIHRSMAPIGIDCM